jgi:ABC-type branched-subunit amino acid transport system ATPase component
MKLLETKGLTKQFGALTAVNNIDLTIEKGVIHSIIGPNGAGKTTLFNLFAGAITPTRGNIIFQGRNIETLKVHERCRKGIGRSFQITNVFPALSVRENIRLAVQSKRKEKFSIFRRVTNLEDVEERTTILVDQFGLGAFENQSYCPRAPVASPR